MDLRVTASPAQLDALAHSAQALEDAFAALQTIAGLEAQEAAAAAEALRTRLESVCQALDGALVGTDHPVVRGLAGLVYSAREAARTLAENAEAGAAEEAGAALALQYEAFTGLPADAGVGERPPRARRKGAKKGLQKSVTFSAKNA